MNQKVSEIKEKALKLIEEAKDKNALEDVRVNDTTNVVDILSELMDIIEYLDVNGFIEDTEVKSIPILGVFFDKTKKLT